MQSFSLSTPSVSASRLLLWLVLAVMAGGSMWSYVLVTWPESVEGLSDLYPRWYGSRELLLKGRNPYSAEVTREIQQWQRGRPAAPGEDEGRFAYPPYVSFLFAPAVRSNFSLVNTVVFWLLLLLAGASVIFYLKFLNWSPPLVFSVAVLFFSVGSFPLVLGARLRQLSLMSGFFIAASLALISKRRYASAGILLALATVKPQLTLLLIAWLLLWTTGNWRARQRLFWSFLLCITVLSAGAELLVRHWIPQFLRATIAYLHYTDGRSILQVPLTRTGGSVAGAFAIAALAFSCWQHRHLDSKSPAFALCTALVLATTLVVIPTLAPHGQILLIPAMFLLLQHASTVWRGGRLCRQAVLATWILLGWQWIAALGVSVAAGICGTGFARRFWLVPLSTSPVLPLAAAITLAIASHRILPPQDITENGRVV